MVFFGGLTLFIACFGLDITFLYLYTPKPSYDWLWDYFNQCYFSLLQRKKKDIQSRFFYINYLSNYTNFVLLHAISFLQDNLFVADLH